MVERFELDFHGLHGEDAYMAKAEDGEYVRYSDYAALEAKLAERVKVEDVLDAASEYMKTQYGIGVLSHPTDRRRILSALEPAAPEGQQEPVAWRYRFVTSIYGDLSDWFMVDDLSSIPPRNDQTIQPLFTRPSERAVTEAHKLLLWAADSFEAHAKTADAPDEIDGYLGSAEMYREAASALKAAMEAGHD